MVTETLMPNDSNIQRLRCSSFIISCKFFNKAKFCLKLNGEFQKSIYILRFRLKFYKTGFRFLEWNADFLD